MAEDNFSFYQLKLIRKGDKPPTWRRAYVPADITFAQMAMILERILETPPSDAYEYEFYQSKFRVTGEALHNRGDFYYSIYQANETFVTDIFNKEDWFTFHYPEQTGIVPAYRVEIEKCGQHFYYSQSKKSLDCPRLIKGKKPQEDLYWHDAVQINGDLIDLFRLRYGDADYRTSSELRQDITAGNGLCAARHPENRTEHYQKSAHESIKQFSELYQGSTDKLLADVLGTAPIAAADDNREMTEYVREMQDSYKNLCVTQLQDWADDIGVNLPSSTKKEMIAAIARHLCTENVMKNELLDIEPELLDIFDLVSTAGGFISPDEDQLERYHKLSDSLDHYFWSYQDDSYSVPKAVRSVWAKLKASGYKEWHRKATWIRKCLFFAVKCYMVITPSELRSIVNLHSDIHVSRSELQSLLGDIAEETSFACLRDGNIVEASLNDVTGAYQMFSGLIGAIEMYRPDVQEINALWKDRYPSGNVHFQEYKKVLTSEFHLNDSLSERACIMSFQAIIYGLDNEQTRKHLQQGVPLAFRNKTHSQRFESTLEQLRLFTPSPYFRGHTQEAFLRNFKDLVLTKDGKLPIITR